MEVLDLYSPPALLFCSLMHTNERISKELHSSSCFPHQLGINTREKWNIKDIYFILNSKEDQKRTYFVGGNVDLSCNKLLYISIYCRIISERYINIEN